MDIFLNNSQENLLEFLVKYYDLIKKIEVIINEFYKNRRAN